MTHPSSQRSDISICHDSFSITPLMLIDGPMSSGEGKRVAGHPKEFFNEQGSGTDHAQSMERSLTCMAQAWLLSNA